MGLYSRFERFKGGGVSDVRWKRVPEVGGGEGERPVPPGLESRYGLV